MTIDIMIINKGPAAVHVLTSDHGGPMQLARTLKVGQVENIAVFAGRLVAVSESLPELVTAKETLHERVAGDVLGVEDLYDTAVQSSQEAPEAAPLNIPKAGDVFQAPVAPVFHVDEPGRIDVGSDDSTSNDEPQDA